MTAKSMQLADHDFDEFARTAKRLAGIELGPNKRQLVVSRLLKRVRALELPDLAAYREYLANNLSSEQTNFINSITTNLTSFFREAHHFDILNAWIEEQGIDRPHVWSSACSTGQEPYSIAIALDKLGILGQSKVVATDIDTNCLKHAVSAVYKREDVETLEISDLRRCFLKGTGDKSEQVILKNHIRDNVHFEQLNLLDQWPSSFEFDAIFCRNVFIYFSPETQEQLISRFASRLKPGGLLFLGHSESMKDASDSFESFGKTSYRRR